MAADKRDTFLRLLLHHAKVPGPRPMVRVSIDMQAVGDWAERRNLAYSGYADFRRAQIRVVVLRAWRARHRRRPGCSPGVRCYNRLGSKVT